MKNQINYCSGDLHWCGVRTSNPGVSRGTGVRVSLLSAIFIIFIFNHSFQNLNALYQFALELFCFLNLFYFVKSCLRFIVIISIFIFFFNLVLNHFFLVKMFPQNLLLLLYIFILFLIFLFKILLCQLFINNINLLFIFIRAMSI